MADSVQNVDGLDGVLAALQNLPTAIAKKTLNGSMRAGAAVIQKEAITRALSLKNQDPYRTPGLVKKMIAVRKRKRYPSNVTTAYAVGVLGGAGLVEKSTKRTRKSGSANTNVDLKTRPAYWRFLEFGTKNMAAHPFLRPAFEAKAQDAISAIAKQLTATLAKAVAAAKGGGS
jgi:HK97 gp10 family phage protein